MTCLLLTQSHPTRWQAQAGGRTPTSPSSLDTTPWASQLITYQAYNPVCFLHTHRWQAQAGGRTPTSPSSPDTSFCLLLTQPHSIRWQAQAGGRTPTSPPGPYTSSWSRQLITYQAYNPACFLHTNRWQAQAGGRAPASPPGPDTTSWARQLMEPCRTALEGALEHTLKFMASKVWTESQRRGRERCVGHVWGMCGEEG